MSFLNENVVILENNSNGSCKEMSDIGIVIQPHHICKVCENIGNTETNNSLKKYCKCETGYYHPKCFKKVILENKSLQCN